MVKIERPNTNDSVDAVPVSEQPRGWLATAWSRLMQLKERRANRAFSATRWFAVLGLAIISALSIGTATVLSRIMGELMLHHDGAVAMEFVQSLLKTQEIQPFFLGAHKKESVLAEFDPNPDDANIEQFFQRIAGMPNVVHANVYDLERRVIWSSNAAAINQFFRITTNSMKHWKANWLSRARLRIWLRH